MGSLPLSLWPHDVVVCARPCRPGESTTKRGDFDPKTIRVCSQRPHIMSASVRRRVTTVSQQGSQRGYNDEPTKPIATVCTGQTIDYNDGICGRADKQTMIETTKNNGPASDSAEESVIGSNHLKTAAPQPTTRRKSFGRTIINHNTPHPKRWVGAMPKWPEKTGLEILAHTGGHQWADPAGWGRWNEERGRGSPHPPRVERERARPPRLPKMRPRMPRR